MESWSRGLVRFCRCVCADQTSVSHELLALAEAVQEALRCDKVVIYNIVESELVAYANITHSHGSLGRLSLREESVLKHVCSSGVSESVPDLRKHPKYNAQVDTHAASIHAVPISVTTEASEPRGVVVAFNPTWSDPAQDLEILEDFASIVSATKLFKNNLRISRWSLPEDALRSADTIVKRETCFDKMTLLLPEFNDGERKVVKPAVASKDGNEGGLIQLDDVEVPVTFNSECLLGASVEMLSFDFDVFLFTVNDLSEMVVHMFYAFDLPATMGITQIQIETFVAAVAQNYNSNNCYHNYYHAANVFHKTVMIVLREPKLMEFMTRADLFSLLIAALCHDINHPGLNNDHHKKAVTDLSIVYNDVSVLEQHHIAVTMRLIFYENISLFSRLAPEVQALLRQQISHAILHTDMSLHQQLLSSFELTQTKLERGEANCRDRGTCEVVLAMVLHLADMMNQCLTHEQADAWERRLSQEYYAQALLESHLGVHVASFMVNETTLDFLYNQMFFICSFCLPLFQVAAEIYPSLAPQLEQVKANKHEVEQKMTVLQARRQEFEDNDIDPGFEESCTIEEVWKTLIAESAAVRRSDEVILDTTMETFFHTIVCDKFRLLNLISCGLTCFLCCQRRLAVVTFELAGVDDAHHMLHISINGSDEPAPHGHHIPKQAELAQSNFNQVLMPDAGQSLLMCKKLTESLGGSINFTTPKYQSPCINIKLAVGKSSRLPMDVNEPIANMSNPRCDAVMPLNLDVIVSARWQSLRLFLTKSLERWNCTATVVRSVEQAKELVKQKQSKVVMLIEYTQYRWLTSRCAWWNSVRYEDRPRMLVMGSTNELRHAQQFDLDTPEHCFLLKPVQPDTLYHALTFIQESTRKECTATQHLTRLRLPRHSAPACLALPSEVHAPISGKLNADTSTSMADNTAAKGVPPRPWVSQLRRRESARGAMLTVSEPNKSVEEPTGNVLCAPRPPEVRQRASKPAGRRSTIHAGVSGHSLGVTMLNKRKQADQPSCQAGKDCKEGDQPQVTALIVEDCLIALRLVVTSLQKLGIQCTVAYDGQECIEILKALQPGEHFDIIFMDLDMPNMNGIEAAEAIRRMQSDGSIQLQHIVAMSANRLLLQDPLFDAFVPKPIYPNKVKGLISSEAWREACIANGRQSSRESLLPIVS